MPATYDVFISYRRRCAEDVNRLAAALDAAGVRYFPDTQKIDDFADVTAEIVTKLAASKTFLAWYSEDYPESRPCQKELALAFIAQQRERSANRQRILLVNAHRGDGHIYPIHLRNLQFARAPERPQSPADYAALAGRIGQNCARLGDLSLGELGGADSLRNLSVGHNRIGDVLSAQGDLAGALASYRASLAIIEKLAAQDPANAGWQRGLFVSYIKLGELAEKAGDPAEALSRYRLALSITERLAKLDPSNATWRNDLAVTRERIAAPEAPPPQGQSWLRRTWRRLWQR